MENLENNQPEEEIQNIGQFQIDRSKGNAAERHASPSSESDEYTENEVQFADDKGSRLNEEIDGPEDEDDEEETDDYNESDIEELDKDPNAYDEDDSEML